MKNQPVISLENIKYQGSGFYDALIDDITSLMKDEKIREGRIHRKLLSKTIFDHTGILIDTKFFNFPDPRMIYILTPVIDINTPLIGTPLAVKGKRFNDKAFKDYQDIHFHFDLKKGKVYGDFKKIPFDMHLPISAFVGDAKLSPEELASFILHEVGHAYTSLFYMGTVARGSLIALYFSQEILGAKTEKERKFHLAKLGSKIERDLSYLEGSTDEELEVTSRKIALDEVYRGIEASATNSDNYESRLWEQLADHFMVMHGGGGVMIKYLGDNSSGHTNVRKSRAHYYTGELMKYVFIFGGIALFPAVVISGIFFTAVLIDDLNPFAGPKKLTYDEYDRRILRIKLYSIDALKDKSISNKQRMQLLEDIYLADRILKDMVVKKSLYTHLIEAINPARRQANSQSARHTHIEQLMNNDLFVKSHSLSGAR